MLLVAIVHGVLPFRHGAHPVLHSVDIGIGAQLQGDGGDLSWLIKETLCKVQRSNEVIIVVGFLMNVEEETRRMYFLDIKTLLRISQIDALATLRRTDGQGGEVYATKLLSQPDAGHSIFHTSGLQHKFGIGIGAVIQDAVDIGAVSKILVYSLHMHHHGSALKGYHRQFVQAVGCRLHLLLFANFGQDGILCVGKFSLDGAHFQLRVEVGIKSSYQIAKSIEHPEHTQQCSGSKGYPRSRNARDDIDSVVTLFRKEVAPCDEEGECHT